MRPHKLLRAVFLVLMFSLVLFLHAQDAETGEDDDDEEDGGISIESDWSRAANLYNKGDQLFCVNLGIVKPLFFMDQSEGYFSTQMNLGGFGSLAYNQFFDSHWFWGVELSIMFASTISKNMYYIVPIGFRTGYQFILNRFEFPLSLIVGIAPQSYAEVSYFGIFAKPTAGAFFRFNPDWSFGLNTSFWWVPQWTRKTRDSRSGVINIHGFFWEFSLGVRYHF